MNFLPVHVPKEVLALATSNQEEVVTGSMSPNNHSSNANSGFSPIKPGNSFGSYSPKYNDDCYENGRSFSPGNFSGKNSVKSSDLSLKLNLLEINDSICSNKQPNDNSPITIRHNPRNYYFQKRENNELHLTEKVDVFQTPYEKERADYMEKKKGFLAGDFKTFHPAPIPLRQPSLLADASYPDSPRVASMLHTFPSIKTLGTAILVRETEVEKRIAGPWIPLDVKIYDR